MCCASAALPPLPAIRSLWPERRAAMITWVILRAAESIAASCAARSSAASELLRWAAIRSWLKRHPHPLQFPALVAMAVLPRKRPGSLMRCARSGLLQHALRDRDHVSGGNVAHAAMVVHGAHRALAGLAG